MIWVLLGVGLWICLSVPIALAVGALLRPRRVVIDEQEAPRELPRIPAARTPMPNPAAAAAAAAARSGSAGR